MGARVDMKRFGRTHWNLLRYLSSVPGGRPDPGDMRCNPRSHPSYAVRRGSVSHDTRLVDGKAEDHDDWDCADDLVAAGLLARRPGPGIPAYDLTPAGRSALSPAEVQVG